MIRVLLALCLSFLALAAPAQERPRTILVLDGSGSMWGQIDGVNKIVIAREVIGTILRDFPPDQELGLTVYGHRRKGDCGDIETVIAPAAGTVDAIVGAVNAINPKGKTPLSAAVTAAAQALRFTEEKATVVLVSDGIETCDVDPCEVGRQLEQLGVDFTAHVVGFDVENDPQARAQLQCLAEETGGIFRTAATASELTEALQTISAPPPPQPVPVSFVATEGAGGPRIGEGLVWTVVNAAGVPVLNGAPTAAPSVDLLPGAFSALVVRTEDGAQAAGQFTVADTAQTVTLVLPELVRPVDVTFLATEGVNGPAILDGLTWKLFDAQGNPLLLDNTDARPVVALMPGVHKAEVTRAEDGATGTADFTVHPAIGTVVVALPEIPRPQAVTFLAKAGGQNIGAGLAWEVSDAAGTVVLADSVDATPSTTLMPGAYRAGVVRTSDGATAAADFVVGRTAQTVILNLPDLPPPPVRVQAFATDGRNGPRINDELVWDLTGPEGPILTSTLAPSLDLELPAGTYTVSVMRPADESFAELRFGVGQVAKTLTLELPELRPLASVSAPATAVQGATVPVEWTGPNGENDYISVAPVGAAGNRYVNYTYTREGPLLDLQMPPVPGLYEVRYVFADGAKVLAAAPIEVTVAPVTLSAPAEALAGATVIIDWTGPDYHNDYIAVYPRGGDRYLSYTYTREGSPLGLTMPTEPGDYDVAYILSQDRKIIARAPITVSTVAATVTAPAAAAAGATVPVDWTGPDYQNDFIAVLPRDGDQWLTYTYTREGSPLGLTMPTDPGDYDVAYILSQDRKIIARAPITVSAVAATVTAPAEAAAGATVPVDWTGPDYQNDFIAVVSRDGDQWLTYTYTREGSPLGLTMPTDPGDYDVAYILSQDRKIIARAPITVSAVAATVTAPAEAAAGATVPVDWTGPDYQNDFIAVTGRGEDGWINYTYTRDGSPAMLKMPAEPGDYDILYVMNQDRTVIARIPVSVTDVAFSVSAPATAPAGSTVQVDWTGPDYQNDYIAVAEQGAPDGKRLGYAYTREGSPLGLVMPPEPGLYEVRYVLSQGNLTRASAVIEVTPVEASLTAPSTAVAGSDVAVDWTGPDYRNDYLAVAPAGTEDNSRVGYSYTRNGSPATVTMPLEPGDYELRYVMANGATVLARQPITLSAVAAALEAPATAPAGGTLDVGWTGPDYQNDFVAIARPGERHSDYHYTRNGNPARLDLPETPGAYELRYVAGQGQTVLHSQPITLE